MTDLDRRAGVNFDITPVVISQYEHHDAIPEAEVEADRVIALFGHLGGASHPWSLHPRGRDATRVGMHLADWAARSHPHNSVLLWLGHGEARGNEAWLAVHETRRPMSGTGISPRGLAEHLTNEWRRRAHEDTWTLVVVEACGADTFVRLVAGALYGQESGSVPERLALIGVGGSGTNYLGAFGRALAATLASFTANDHEVRLSDFVARLENRLDEGRVLRFGLHGTAPLRLVRPYAQTITAPLDVYEKIKKSLQELPADQRAHFLPAAQGAEQGELAWFFVGRDAELRRIAAWLRDTPSGMLVVTGRAGVGKSALLGNILIHSSKKLRALAEHLGDFTDVPEDLKPQLDCFDVVVHLTGLTATDLIERIADAAGVTMPSRTARPDIGWLLSQLARRHFTVLVDGLDEAQDPITMATSILRGLARLPSCRVIVGTRASTTEGVDGFGAGNEDLLDALGRPHHVTTMVLERDAGAVEAYVRRRLAAARDEHRLDCDAEVIADIAREVAERDRQFLFARLAVHEILADPELVTPQRRHRLLELLRHDHRALFEAAVSRLRKTEEINYFLLEALALARGRGLPRADQVWAVVAGALSGGAQVGETDIDALLVQAAPYVMLDIEDGQSVYRLAHRTFQEYFEARQI